MVNKTLIFILNIGNSIFISEATQQFEMSILKIRNGGNLIFSASIKEICDLFGEAFIQYIFCSMVCRLGHKR